MLLQEFDTIIDRMQLALDIAKNLGQSIEEAKILYQMNEVLPENLQMELDDVYDENMAKQTVSLYKNQIKSKISEYREELMLN
ncbi:MAG: hypothetical protein OEQ12_06680 [Nitrosopumilus sp.]|nr:hypothetical protein [Nitrosopumilus sp.]